MKFLPRLFTISRSSWSELKKALRCYQMVPFWEKEELDSWDSLKVVIDGSGIRGGLVYHGEGCSGIYEGRFSAGIVL